jgi:3',5'-nucleoside bisphosphate phosphatase
MFIFISSGVHNQLPIGILGGRIDARMRHMIDLHIHTTHSSDGQHSPGEIMAMANKLSFTGIAFADHMDISAVAIGQRTAGAFNLKFFSGVEISTILNNWEYHLLFYGFDPNDAVLKDFLVLHCAAIWEKAVAVLDLLSAKGFTLLKEDIDAWGRSVPTGVTFLNALKKKNSKDNRLYEYLFGSKSSSPYLNFYKDFSLTDIGGLLVTSLPDLKETINLLKGRGILILAHPGNARRDFLVDLKRHGLNGIEAYSSHHSGDTTHYLVDMARSLGLLISAGSDFHGELIKPDIPFGTIFGEPDEKLIGMLDAGV